MSAVRIHHNRYMPRFSSLDPSTTAAKTPATAPIRLEPERSATWPPTTAARLRLNADRDNTHIPSRPSTVTMAFSPTKNPGNCPHSTKPAADALFEHDLNRRPDQHFLSPVHMYEYEDWASDDDDDDDDEDFVEWDADITDFALFADDRRRAAERNEAVPDRWSAFLARQESALERAVQRHRADRDSHSAASTPIPIPARDALPQLTPDTSPDLRGDPRPPAFRAQRLPRAGFPSLKAPSQDPVEGDPAQEASQSDEEVYDDAYDFDDSDSEDDEDDDDLPVAFLVERARERRRLARALEKPGLRFSRTLSGKAHVWRRPGWALYDVDEDVEGEGRAEG